MLERALHLHLDLFSTVLLAPRIIDSRSSYQEHEHYGYKQTFNLSDPQLLWVKWGWVCLYCYHAFAPCSFLFRNVLTLISKPCLGSLFLWSFPCLTPSCFPGRNDISLLQALLNPIINSIKAPTVLCDIYLFTSLSTSVRQWFSRGYKLCLIHFCMPNAENSRNLIYNIWKGTGTNNEGL